MTRLAPMCVAVALVVSSATAVAQEAKTESPGETVVPVTRADLGWSYLRLELAYFANQPTDNKRVADINRAFDTATKKFFSGKFAETIEEVNQLTESLIAENPTNSLTVALSLKPTIDPPVAIRDQTNSIQIRLTSIYPVDIATDTSLRLSLKRIAGGDEVVSKPVSLNDVQPGAIDTTIPIGKSAKLDTGSYSVVLSGENGVSVDIGQLNIVSSSLDAIREQNSGRLDAIDSEQANIISAVQACRSRNALLQDQPSSKNSSQFLSDLSQLADQVDREIESLATGNDPYQRRSGDYWRTFSASDKDKPVPCRVYAPEKVIGDKPVPLVIALHGAGGDENMFFAGYGAGLIKQLAEQHRFLVASPATTAIGGGSGRFEALITELSSDYAVDPEAIYLIGHSMGGFTTVSLASKHHDQIAAACCLAGGGKPPTESIPPMLIIAGELDSVVPTDFLKLSAQQAIDAGLPLKFRVQENYGHTLLVGAVLGDAVDWLLKHRLNSPDRSE